MHLFGVCDRLQITCFGAHRTQGSDISVRSHNQGGAHGRDEAQERWNLPQLEHAGRESARVPLLVGRWRRLEPRPRGEQLLPHRRVRAEPELEPAGELGCAVQQHPQPPPAGAARHQPRGDRRAHPRGDRQRRDHHHGRAGGGVDQP